MWPHTVIHLQKWPTTYCMKKRMSLGTNNQFVRSNYNNSTILHKHRCMYTDVVRILVLPRRYKFVNQQFNVIWSATKCGDMLKSETTKWCPLQTSNWAKWWPEMKIQKEASSVPNWTLQTAKRRLLLLPSKMPDSRRQCQRSSIYSHNTLNSTQPTSQVSRVRIFLIQIKRLRLDMHKFSQY